MAAGPNIMLGYYNKPEETARTLKVIDGKTWLCTGDIGSIVKVNGIEFLKITDRKKGITQDFWWKIRGPGTDRK